MFANIRKKNPAKRIFAVRRSDDLISFLSILLYEHHVSPGRCAQMAGVVVGISRPDEPIVRNFVPFLASDLASFAADAHRRVGEETDLDAILDVGILPLIGAVNAFADHRSAAFPSAA